MGTLEGRLALVTGASRGIGEHCARSLAEQGARVALAARSEQELLRVAEDLPNDPVVLTADLAQPGAGGELAVAALEALGGIDILVNNAGVSEIKGQDEMIMRLNYHAPLETTKALVRQMAERGHGSVIHMSSVAGATGNIVFYDATMKMKDEIATGTQLQASMRETGLFPNMVVQMVAIGEESGAIDTMLGKVADWYEQEVDDAVEALTSLLEPMIKAFLGVVIGGIVVGMYLPIFKMGAVV